MAVPVAFLAARNTSPSPLLLRPLAMFVIVASRSINALIWALLLVAILGLVGAGGLGLKLQASLTTLAWPQVTMIMIVILGTVVASEWISAKVRRAPI